MRRTKVKNVSSKPKPSMVNAATQTTDLDAVLEMAKLQEKVKLLQLENDVLRQHVPQKLDGARSISPCSTAQVTPKINKERSICGCKGDCLTKRCSCAKKNSKCGTSCKCSDDVCQNRNSKTLKENQEQENKENINKENTKKQMRTNRNEPAKKIKDNNTWDDKIMNDENVVFNPMKPRHQLSRTPPSSKKINEINQSNDQSMLNNTIRTLSYDTLYQQEIKSSDIKDIKEEEVDWEQHTAQLVPCKKCKRTFMPHRIQKHEACCKKI